MTVVMGGGAETCYRNRILTLLLQRDDTKGQNIKTEEDCCSEAVLNLNSLMTLLKRPYMLQDESPKPPVPELDSPENVNDVKKLSIV